MTTASMTDFTSIDGVATPPFWIPVLAGLPITLCMLVMGLPDFGLSHFAAFRSLFVVAYVVWSVPLALIQRSLWRRRIPWWFSIPGLLALTYVLSLVNNAIGQLQRPPAAPPGQDRTVVVGDWPQHSCHSVSGLQSRKRHSLHEQSYTSFPSDK